jgi:O-antigen ligase
MRTSSSIASIPNPTPLLFLVTAIAILAWPDAVGITALTVIALIVLPLAVALLARSPQASIVAIIVASAVPRLFIPIGGLKARPEHIVSGLMLLALPFLWKKQTQPVQWIKADYWAIAFVALMLFSSAIMSVAPLQTTKWALQQILALLPYFLLRVLITDWARFRVAFRTLVISGAVTLIYAVISFYSYVLFGSSFGVATDQYASDIPATYGLQYEGNILGAYGAAFTILMLVLYMQKREPKFLFGYALCGLASVCVSLSRAALGAAVLVIAVTGYIAFRRKLLDRKVVFRIAAATLATALLLSPLILQHFQERFSTVDISDVTSDPNTLTRAVTTVSALDEVAKHPLFGGGISSFQLAFDWQDFGTEWEGDAWIGNTELRILHDTGIAGLIAFIGFLFLLVRQARKLLKNKFKIELLALLLSGLVYCITFQTTEGTLLAFPWVLLGLIGCAVSIMYREESAGKLSLENARS